MIMKALNWFVVSEANMKVADEMFKRDGFVLPSPRCFGRLVKSFDLDPRPKAKIPQWKQALDALRGLIF